MKAKFPCTRHEQDLLKMAKEADFKWENLTYDDHLHWCTYQYAWRKFSLGIDFDEPAAFDKGRLWYVDDRVKEAFAAYQSGLIYSTFKNKRYRTGGTPVPAPYVDDEETLRERHFIAMIYRRAHAAGETLPVGLKPDDPMVIAAVHKYQFDPREKEQERERNAAKGNPEEYVKICARQFKENIARMPTWPGDPEGE